MKQTTMTPRLLLEDLYDKADGGATYERQPCSKWDAEYARKLSEVFGVKIVLRAGRATRRDAAVKITTVPGRRGSEPEKFEYEIVIYRNQPGHLEHEIAHYIQFAVFGNKCMTDRKNYAIEEIRAESTAYVICMMTGNHSRENMSVPYMRKYTKAAKIDPRSLIPEIERRVAEFVSRGIMPPKYSPIEQKNVPCINGGRHAFSIFGGRAGSQKCVRCGYNDRGPAVA